jgi:hypothetical protein
MTREQFLSLQPGDKILLKIKGIAEVLYIEEQFDCIRFIIAENVWSFVTSYKDVIYIPSNLKSFL